MMKSIISDELDLDLRICTNFWKTKIENSKAWQMTEKESTISSLMLCECRMANGKRRNA